MSRRLRAVVLLWMGMALWLSPIFSKVSLATVNPSVTIVTTSGDTRDRIALRGTVDAINQAIRDDGCCVSDLFTYSEKSDSCTVTFDSGAYNKLLQANKQRVMEISLNTIQESNISNTNRNKLYNFVADLDSATSALVRQLSEDVRLDFVSAYEMFRPFTGTLGKILGVLTLAIFVFLGLGIVIDLGYINLAGMKMLIDGISKEGNPKGVSMEAVHAIKESESNQNQYRNPTMMYFKHKGVSLFFLFLCILYLTSGKIFDLIAGVVDLFGGMV